MKRRPYLRSGLAALGVAVLGLVNAATACLAFDGLPTAPPDAGADVATVLDAGPVFLDPLVAARVCSTVVSCPRLGTSIARTMGIPLTLANGVTTSFSWCMSWLTTPVDPTRTGLAVQRELLGRVAEAVDCDDAISRLPVQVTASADLDPTCTNTSCNGNVVNRCGIETPCGPPVFPSDARCVVVPVVGAVCVNAVASCTSTCVDSAHALGCISDAAALTADCTVAGLGCAMIPGDGGKLAPHCVAGSQALTCGDDQFFAQCYDATRVRSCAGRSAGLLFDCAAVGGKCTPVAAGVGAYCATKQDCDPFAVEEGACDARTGDIATCIGGVRLKFACAAIGKGCATTATSAYCR